jgi:hypothetical protein
MIQMELEEFDSLDLDQLLTETAEDIPPMPADISSHPIDDYAAQVA